jgi:hypothetical protein
MSNFSPTQEQVAIVDAFQTGENLKVTAVAGSGKTSTLRLLGESTDKRGAYLAFNKAIQLDAEASFPSNVKARTGHSHAFATHGRLVIDRLPGKGQRLFGRQIANILGIYDGFEVEDGSLAPSQVAPLVMEMINRFSCSADSELTTYHAPYVEGIENRSQFAAFLLPYAQKAWSDINSKNGKLTVSHDHYLKQWALTNPTIKADFILFDEAQDANPVIAKVVSDQQAQIIAVGDESQSIYGWRGAVNAMENFPGQELTLTQSFRFGPKIADEANVWLDLLGAPIRVKGLDSIDSKVEPCESPDAVLCRTNAACIAEAVAGQRNDKKVAIVGGTKDIELFTKAADRLMSQQPIDHPDLVAFKSWPEVQAYVENDKAGADLKVRVKLIDAYGVDSILEVCVNSVDEKKADIIVSTAHKAKGREWGSVRVAHDFREPDPDVTTEVPRTDAMLSYVTVTRAKNVLDLGGLAWGRNWIKEAS